MFQFTIRDLVLVTAIAGLCLGWAGDRHEKATRIERLEKVLAPEREFDTHLSPNGGRPGIQGYRTLTCFPSRTCSR